jgi:3,4-dihydroxy 2-butanone 4-phosphate synthase/GTP cyclohydrolase II
MNSDGTMARLPKLQVFCERHELKMISIADLIDYRLRTERHVQRVSDTFLETSYGVVRAIGYSSSVDETERIALVHGELGDGEGVLVRTHSECLRGDLLGSLNCNCRAHLDAALSAVAARGRGVVLYARSNRDVGGSAAIHMPSNASDKGIPYSHHNASAASRDQAACAQILRDLGVKSVRLPPAGKVRVN